MLSPITESRLADLISAIASNERDVERQRRILADEPLYAPSSCFALLDRPALGYLTAYDIKDFLRNWGVMVTITEAEQLIELIAKRSPLRLYSSDFSDMILPKDPISKSIARRRDIYPPLPLGRSAEYSLSRLIRTIIDGNSRLSYYRSSLSLRYDYSAFDAFRTIDKYRTGYINSSDLYAFLNRAGIARFDDAEAFIRALDKDYDGKLSYSEFADGLIPSFARPVERYAYNERRRPYRESSYERPVPRTEYKRERLLSADRFASPQYERPAFSSSYSGSFYKNYSSPINNEPYTSPIRSSYVSPIKKEYESPIQKSFMTDYTSPSRSAYNSPITKKLEYSSDSFKQRQLGQDLALVMERQLVSEKKIEKAKEDLALQHDFNLMEGFRVFDYDRKGYIYMNEFYDGMKVLGVSGGYNDISLLFKRLDTDLDGKVRYSDYYFVMAPKRKEYERLLMERPPYTSSQLNGFTSMTRILYRELLNLLVENEQESNFNKQKLRRNFDFDPYDAFKAMDYSGKGSVTMGGVILAIINS